MKPITPKTKGYYYSTGRPWLVWYWSMFTNEDLKILKSLGWKFQTRQP